jgi:hypothetical protein
LVMGRDRGGTIERLQGLLKLFLIKICCFLRFRGGVLDRNWNGVF